jgi:translocation and assembly module TamA
MGQDPEFQKLIQKQAMQTGSVFTHPEYDSFKAELAKLASERGYFRAAFSENRVEIDLKDYVARVYLNYDGGPRFRFGVMIIHLISSSNCSMYSTIPITFRR